MIDLNVTFIVITKNRPRRMKRSVNSILEAKLDSFSLVLIDDSDSRNFLLTKNFLQSLSIPFIQFSSVQAGQQVEKTLEKTDLATEEKRFIRNCTGLRSPFCGYVEGFDRQDKVTSESTSSGLWFAPYSSARNLGIYCAVRFFNSDIIFFLDDDCLILHPKKLRNQLQLMKTKLDQRSVVAIAGIYKDVKKFELERASERRITYKAFKALRGMEEFLRKSFAVEETRFTLMPPHMLGGALILSKKVFYNIPFDPYVARGEDHAYAWDLKGFLGKSEIAVRDSHFLVGHQVGKVSQRHLDMNVLRDIFRFVYVRAKTGRSFIPFFVVRWALASLFQLFLNPSKYAQCKNELWALIFSAPRFAKENACRFRRNFRAWSSFLSQSKV